MRTFAPLSSKPCRRERRASSQHLQRPYIPILTSASGKINIQTGSLFHRDYYGVYEQHSQIHSKVPCKSLTIPARPSTSASFRAAKVDASIIICFTIWQIALQPNSNDHSTGNSFILPASLNESIGQEHPTWTISISLLCDRPGE